MELTNHGKIEKLLRLRYNNRFTTGQISEALFMPYDEALAEMHHLYNIGVVEQAQTKLGILVWQLTQAKPKDVFERSDALFEHTPLVAKLMRRNKGLEDESEARQEQALGVAKEFFELAQKEADKEFAAIQLAQEHQDDGKGESESGKGSGGLTLEMKPVEATTTKLQAWRDARTARANPALPKIPTIQRMGFDDWIKSIDESQEAVRIKKQQKAGGKT